MKQIESFFWGIPAALGALLLQIAILAVFLILQDPMGKMQIDTLARTLPGIGIAVLLEEIFKYLIIAKRIDAISLGMSYFFNSLLFGLGFAMTEQVIGYLTYGQVSEGELFPIFGAMSVHIITSQLIGYRISAANPMKARVILPAILFATIVHFFYNFLEYSLWYATLYISYGSIAILICYTLLNAYRFKKQA